MTDEVSDLSQHYLDTIADIDRERTRLRRLLRGREARALNERPTKGNWSIIENVRHLLFAEQLHLGQFLREPSDFSALGMTGMTANKFARVGTASTTSVDVVFNEWDAVHRRVRAGLRSATGAEVDRALWRNHRHLRAHIALVERRLRQLGR